MTTDPLNPAQAVANSLAQGATPSASVSSTSYDTVTITFAEVDTTTGGVEIPASDYVLQRYPPTGGSPVTVTPSCSGTGMITCTESSVPDGTWQYTDTPTYAANWVGTESAKSGPVAVSTTATVSVTYPVDSTSYGAVWVRLDRDDYGHGLAGGWGDRQEHGGGHRGHHHQPVVERLVVQ